MVDNVRVYNLVLSAEEVQQNRDALRHHDIFFRDFGVKAIFSFATRVILSYNLLRIRYNRSRVLVPYDYQIHRLIDFSGLYVNEFDRKTRRITLKFPKLLKLQGSSEIPSET